MNKYQEALDEMYAVLNDSQKWYKHKGLLQELVNKATPMKITYSKGGMQQCPNCEHTGFIKDYDTDNYGEYLETIYFSYCAHCGQKLEWE